VSPSASIKAKTAKPKPGSSEKPKQTSKGTTASISQPLQSGASASGGAVDAGNRNLGLTVRIEINLPATGDQETYDKIFKSIRENLLNG
jgi:hypothetical protein